MHILIVEGFRPGHECLKRIGAEITLLIEEFRISGNEEGFYDRYFTVRDNSPLEAWINLADNINKISKIDAVINFHENRQYETAAIAEHLNLNYHSYEECKIAKDKLYMRQFFLRNNIDSIHSATLKEVLDPKTNISVSFPVIVKPIDGWASQNIYKIDNKESLIDFIDKENIELADARVLATKDSKTKIKTYMIEEFINGAEFSVETFSYKGKHKLIAITKKFKDSDFIEFAHVLPANISNEDYDIIKNKVLIMLEKIGHQNGPMHTELILTDSKEVHFVETHLRMGGDNIPDLIKIASGFDMLETWSKLILDGDLDWESIPELKSSDNSFSMIRYFLAKGSIVNKKVEKINENKLAFNNTLIEYKFFVDIQDAIQRTYDSFTRLGYFILSGKNVEELTEEALELKESDIFTLA